MIERLGNKRRLATCRLSRNLTSAAHTIRFLAADAIQKANSGHPGLPGRGGHGLYAGTGHMKHNPSNPKWVDKDRFVLSAGHGSSLLYALLHLTGHDLPLSELQKFRQWGSKTPGHPESHVTLGLKSPQAPWAREYPAL